MAKNKKKQLKELNPGSYTIYGIFNFNTNKLIYVSMDYDTVELEFQMENYDDNYDIVSFDIVLT